MRRLDVSWPVLAALVVFASGCGSARETGQSAGTPAPSEAEVRAANEAAGAVGTLLPVDEGERDPGFATFRNALLAAAAAQDTAAILAVTHPDIRVSFGADNGIAAFRGKWFSGAPDRDFFVELRAVLELGGTFRGDSQFVAPYVFALWPEHLDGFTHVAVTDADVSVRAAPLDDAAVLHTVSYAIFPLDDRHELADALSDWTVIDRGQDTPGFIATPDVRSPLHYRAFFQRQGGEWRMNLFIAGD